MSNKIKQQAVVGEKEDYFISTVWVGELSWDSQDYVETLVLRVVDGAIDWLEIEGSRFDNEKDGLAYHDLMVEKYSNLGESK